MLWGKTMDTFKFIYHSFLSARIQSRKLVSLKFLQSTNPHKQTPPRPPTCSARVSLQLQSLNLHPVFLRISLKKCQCLLICQSDVVLLWQWWRRWVGVGGVWWCRCDGGHTFPAACRLEFARWLTRPVMIETADSRNILTADLKDNGVAPST